VVVLVGKVKETRIDPLRLKDVEQAQPIRFRKTVIQRIVDDELRGAKVRDVVLGVEFLVGGVRVVDCAIKVVPDEPELYSYVSEARELNLSRKLICVEVLTFRSVRAQSI
jgi:hypothetical protein